MLEDVNTGIAWVCCKVGQQNKPKEALPQLSL